MLLINKRRSYFQANVGKNEQENEVLSKKFMYANTQVPKPHVSGVIQSKT